MFLSIFAATCRPENIVKFLDNLAETAEDLSSFEVLLKVDDDDHKTIEVIQAYQQRAKFSVRYIATEKLDGYYSLHVGYNELLKIAHPDSYFCWLLTDEIRLETKGWDTILKKYIHFYPDDIFRIKLSIFQLKNYNDFFECLPAPDNYAVTTRKWLEITGGWGNFWGPDSWHQCVDYYLGFNKNEQNPYGIWRSFPIYDIKVGGQEAGQGISNQASLAHREKMIQQGWKQHSTHKAQENFARLAIMLNAHIIASANNEHQYIVVDDTTHKTISMCNIQKNKFYGTWSYQLPTITLQIKSAKKVLTKYHLLPGLYLLKSKIIKFIKIKLQVPFNTKFSISVFLNALEAKLKKTCCSFSRYHYQFAAHTKKNRLIKMIFKYPYKLFMNVTILLSYIILLLTKKMYRILAYLINAPYCFCKFIYCRLKKLFFNQNKIPSRNIYLYDGKHLKLIDHDSI